MENCAGKVSRRATLARGATLWLVLDSKFSVQAGQESTSFYCTADPNH
jgi:hypothetical protein